MEFLRDKKTGRIHCADDPELWAQPILSDQRLDLPFRFILAIDRRRIGLAVGNTLSGMPSDEAEQRASDRPLLIIRVVGLHVRGQSLTEGVLETNASRFASRAQQDRAIQFFLGAVEQMLPFRHVTGEILPPRAQFAPEIEAGLHSGAFIEA